MAADSPLDGTPTGVQDYGSLTLMLHRRQSLLAGGYGF